MAYGDAVVSPLPSTTDAWGDELDELLTEIVDCIEAKVTPAGMNMNADLDMNQHVVSDLGALRYTNQSATLTGGTDTRKLYTVSGELYFTDGSQNAVKITSGGLLNASATGGITGSGYGSSGVEVNWNAANTEYRLKSGAGADAYADLQTDTVRFNDGSANWVALDGPTGLSSNLTYTLPNAMPASNALIQSTSGGVLSAEIRPSISGLTISDGDIKHGTRELWIPGGAGWKAGSAAWGVTVDFNWNADSGDNIFWTLPIPTGKKIISCALYMFKGDTATSTFSLVRRSGGGTTMSTVTNDTEAGSGARTLGFTANHVLEANYVYALTCIAVHANDIFYDVYVSYSEV